MKGIEIITVTPENVEQHGICCIKNNKSDGVRNKAGWFKKSSNESLTIKLAVDATGSRVGFVEYIDSEYAWRPVSARNFLFIHCIAVYVKDLRNAGIAGALIAECIADAAKREKSGVCVTTSESAWMSGGSIFRKNGFEVCEKKGRFDLWVRKLTEAENPAFIDWEYKLREYHGWHLLYSNQCPWHIKSVLDISAAAKDAGIPLHVTCIETPLQAQQNPSGYGTFALIKDGVMLEDHYLSQTRFKTILSKYR